MLVRSTWFGVSYFLSSHQKKLFLNILPSGNVSNYYICWPDTPAIYICLPQSILFNPPVMDIEITNHECISIMLVLPLPLPHENCFSSYFIIPFKSTSNHQTQTFICYCNHSFLTNRNYVVKLLVFVNLLRKNIKPTSLGVLFHHSITSCALTDDVVIPA